MTSEEESLEALNQIKTLLHKLRVEEYADLQRHIDLLRKVKGRSKKRSNDEMFYATICRYVHAKTGAYTPSLHKFSLEQEATYKLMLKNLDTLDFWISDIFGKLTRSERSRTYSVSVDLICASLEKFSVALTPKSLINNTPRVPGLMNDSFPYYIECGLLKEVLDVTYTAWDNVE